MNKLLGIESILKQKYAIEKLHETVVTSSEYEQILETIEQTLEIKGARIVITGVGKNSNLATKASETFASLGIMSMYVNAGHYAHGDAGFIGDNDVVIHVSRSGKTEELQAMAMHLKQIKPDVKQILLHCNQELQEKHEENFDIVLGVPGIVECDEYQLAPTTSTTVLLVLLDSIAINVSSHLGFTSADFYKYHPGGSLGQMLKQSLGS